MISGEKKTGAGVTGLGAMLEGRNFAGVLTVLGMLGVGVVLLWLLQLLREWALQLCFYHLQMRGL